MVPCTPNSELIIRLKDPTLNPQDRSNSTAGGTSTTDQGHRVEHALARPSSDCCIDPDSC